MKVNELMALSIAEFASGVRTFAPTDRVSEVIGFMRETSSYEAIVEEGERTSIITVRDLLDLTSLETRLSKLMHQVPRLNRQNTVSDVATLMLEYRTRSMPMYDGDRLAGQVTSGSIIGKLMESEIPVKVSSIMTRKPVTIEPSATVASARELMRRKKVDQVPVVEDGRLVGVVTSGSIFFGMAPKTDREEKGNRQEGRLGESLENYGTGNLLTNEITDPLAEVYRRMRKAGSNYSVVMNTGEIQGIVTLRDFMKILARRTAAPPLPMYVVGLPDDPFEAAAAREKFTEAIQLLRKGFPEITEARAIIKASVMKSSKKRCQVDVLILSPKERYSYSVFSYQVADAFDMVNDWAKRLISQRKNDRRKPTTRLVSDAPRFSNE